MIYRNAFHSCFLIFLISVTADAGIAVSYNDLTGYDNSDVVYVDSADVVSGGSESLFLRDTRGALQSFTVTSTTEISAVNVLSMRMVEGESFRIEIREFSANPSSANITSSFLSSSSTLVIGETITISAADASGFDGDSANDALSTVTWNLPSSVTLNGNPTTGGNNYALIINADSDNTGIRWAFNRNGDVYANRSGPRSHIGYFESNDANGGNYNYQADGFGDPPNTDMSIALVSIPEPGTLMLVGCALMAALIIRRR